MGRPAAIKSSKVPVAVLHGTSRSKRKPKFGGSPDRSVPIERILPTSFRHGPYDSLPPSIFQSPQIELRDSMGSMKQAVNPTEVELCLLTAGELVGHVDVLEQTKFFSCSAIALEPVTLLQIPAQPLRDVVSRLPHPQMEAA